MEPELYLYQHPPKCGGRSFIHQCKEWFATAHDRLQREAAESGLA